MPWDEEGWKPLVTETILLCFSDSRTQRCPQNWILPFFFFCQWVLPVHCLRISQLWLMGNPEAGLGPVWLLATVPAEAQGTLERHCFLHVLLYCTALGKGDSTRACRSLGKKVPAPTVNSEKGCLLRNPESLSCPAPSWFSICNNLKLPRLCGVSD